MNNLVTRTLIRALSLAFVTTFVTFANQPVNANQSENAHQLATKAPANIFASDEWKKNAQTLEDLMGVDLKKGLRGIHAMYSAKAHAEKYLQDQAEAQAHENKKNSLSVAARTEKLLEPVKNFLPEIKKVAHLIEPLVKISLNRALLDDEVDPCKDATVESLSFNTSIFKKFLETKEPFEKFVASEMKTDTHFTQMCREFHRVFGDFIHHAFPTLTKEYTKMMKELQKRQQQLGRA